MVTELDVTLPDGRTLHVYDAGPDGSDHLAVLWHHGTPNIGAPPRPLLETAGRLGLRWVGYDRPGYGGSTDEPDRRVGSAAGYAAAVADALGVDRFATVGHSGGSPHALACAALLPDRVVASVSIAGLAPYGVPGLDWFAGMADAGVASLRAALAGRAEKERHEASAPDLDLGFTDADLAALAGDWSWLHDVVGPALAAGPGGLVADDLAYVAPWGFDPAQISVPVLLLHGDRDRVVPVTHSRWLAGQIPSAELRVGIGDGHLSVLESSPAALEWVAAQR